jgi:hypothetical protein
MCSSIVCWKMAIGSIDDTPDGESEFEANDVLSLGVLAIDGCMSKPLPERY